MLSVRCWKRSVFAFLSVAVCLFGVALAFECTDGCVIADSYLNDDSCDCIDCGDETEFTCDSCPGCPQLCGQNTTCVVPTATGFKCTDGCHIADSKVDDGNCDCVDCADENAFSCDSCLNGCPDSCGASTICAQTTPNQIEKVAKSGKYQCVNATSDLVPWVWIAIVSLWHYAKIIWYIYTTNDKSKIWLKQILVQLQVIALTLVFLWDAVRFHYSRSALNGWQQYTCFAEIWMFSSNALRIYSIVCALPPYMIPASFSFQKHYCFDANITTFSQLFVLPTLLLHIPIYVTHVLPVFFIYCWVLFPYLFALLVFAIAIWFRGGFDEMKLGPSLKNAETGESEFVDFANPLYVVTLLGSIFVLGSGLIVFSVALGANYYRTGDYMHSISVAMCGRNTVDFFSAMSSRRILKFVIWVF